MLTHLQLRDLVIVDHVELSLGVGLTALTGETGAGKSIIVDALLLVAGGRGTGDLVRKGAERAEVAASFDSLPGPAITWLKDQSIEHAGEVVVRRVVGLDGRSRAYINGQVVPLQSLREFGEFLLEVHGQQEFQHLVKRSAQRDLLDQHANLTPQTLKIASIFERYRAAVSEFEALQAAAVNREARLDLLSYQLTELKSEVTSVAEIEALFIEQKRVSSRGRLAAAAQSALEAIADSESSAHDLLSKAQAAVRNVADADPTLAEAGRLVAEAVILTQEATLSLRRYVDALDMDPSRQEEIERRAASLEALARKHRLGVSELPAQLARTESELEALQNAQLTLGNLEQNISVLAEEYRATAHKLSLARKLAAHDLGAKITQLMQSLSMVGGQFEVSVTANSTEFSPHGSDEIEFLVSANPGQAPKNLAKVASGGELSRISLAVQVAASANTSALCRVFDEVDAGIGGAVAEIVGRQLRQLGEHAQVLCVTHLAQVASQAHSQFCVVKQNAAGKTLTTVQALSKEERVDEIARMLGGINISDKALAHARDMLEPSGQEPRSARSGTPSGRKPGRRAGGRAPGGGAQ